MTRVALDTNILVYAEALERSADDRPKIAVSRHLIKVLLATSRRPVVSVQVLAELHRVLVRKGRLPPGEATGRVARVRAAAEVVPPTLSIFDAALELVADHSLAIFDAMIVSAAAEARCDLLVSEDLHAGFAWRGVIVANPFKPTHDRRLSQILAGGASSRISP